MAAADSNSATLGCLRKLRDFVSKQQAVPEELHKKRHSLDSFVTSCTLRAAVQMKIIYIFLFFFKMR